MSGLIVLGLRILLALALYGFLGWALWTIWSDLKNTGLQAEIYKVRPIHLEVEIMGQAPFLQSFSQSEVILGRDQTCDVKLDHESISAKHAKLRFHHGQWWLEDLESTNGTRLNGDKLTTATVLTSGDEIKFGNANIIVNPIAKQVIPE